MRVVFFGSPAFAVPTLEALSVSAHRVLAVVSQPDRPRGRSGKPVPSPVKERALALDLPVLTPVKLRGPFTAELAALGPDALVVVAYGRILPPEVLAVPSGGAINVHASLLPRHRGASPVHAAILAGDRESGVTTMRMDQGLDTGPVLLEARTAIGAEEDAEALGARLARMGAELLIATLDALEGAGIEERPQDPARATYAPKLAPEDAPINWTRDADELARRVRGLRPWPGARTRLPDGRRLEVVRARALEEVGDAAADAPGAAGGAAPGTVLGASPDGLAVACGRGRLLLLEVVPEGKRAMPGPALVHGRLVAPGDRLGP